MENEPTMPARRTIGKGKIAAIIMLLLFASIPLAPMAMTRGREEVLLWKTASALKQFDAGDHGDGLARLRTLTDLQLESIQVQNELADRLTEIRKYDEAAFVAKRLHLLVAQQIHDDQAHPVKLWSSASLYARCLVAAGHRSEGFSVLQTARKTLKDSGTLDLLDFRSVVNITNELAYNAALAGEQLGLANFIMDEVFATSQRETKFGKAERITTGSKVAISTALISCELGKPNEIVPLLNHEIALREDIASGFGSTMILEYYRWMAGEAAGESEPGPMADARTTFASLRFELALLLAVRAMVLEQVGDESARLQSVRDRFRIVDLGYEGESLLKLLPNVRQCIAEAQDGSMFLDTAGLILLRQGRPRDAIHSLDLACISNDFALSAIHGPLGERPDETLEPAFARKMRDKMSATLHLHRGQCREALGNKSLAAADFEQVEKLGHDRDDPSLF